MDFGIVLQRVNQGIFPRNESEMRAALKAAYDDDRFKLPPLFEINKKNPNKPVKRHKLAGFLFDRQIKVRAPHTSRARLVTCVAHAHTSSMPRMPHASLPMQVAAAIEKQCLGP